MGKRLPREKNPAKWALFLSFSLQIGTLAESRKMRLFADPSIRLSRSLFIAGAYMRAGYEDHVRGSLDHGASGTGRPADYQAPQPLRAR